MEDKDLELILEGMLDLENRMAELEVKFNLKIDNSDLWFKLRKLALRV